MVIAAEPERFLRAHLHSRQFFFPHSTLLRWAGLHAQDREHLFTQLATLRQLCLAAAGQPDGR